MRIPGQSNARGSERRHPQVGRRLRA
jgi:hypothetical protein